MTQLYLDHNSTTPIDPDIAVAMAECFAQGYVNPASQHQGGQLARRILESAREEIAAILGLRTTTIQADSLIFTSGGTEANNLALFGFAGRSPSVPGSDKPARIIISAIEHPSVMSAAAELERRGWEIAHLPVNLNCEVQFETLSPLLADGRTRLVSVMLANNETGVLQNVREIAAICKQHQVPFHTDAVQAVGKIPVDFQSLDVDAMTIAAHKFQGPVGIGALALRYPRKIEPLLHGGFQQSGLRPGTESVALAVGMCHALKKWQANAAERRAHLTNLRDIFESTLFANLPDVAVNGPATERLPNTSNVSFLGLDRQSLLLALDMSGIACSTGSACASGSSEPSPVLVAMGLDESRIGSALRFSFGASTTVADVQESCRRIIQICQQLRQRAAVRKSPSPARQ